jgi:uncharacterized protein (DUF302 family)
MTTDAGLAVLMPAPIAAAEARLREALKVQGFGVLTEVDVQATLREKLGTDFYPYKLLGVCNPDLAYRALEVDPRLGVFLPCTIALYDTGTGTEVHIQDPTIAVGFGPPELAPLVEQARDRLARVIAAVT